MIELAFYKKKIDQLSIVFEIMKFKVWCQIWLPGTKRANKKNLFAEEQKHRHLQIIPSPNSFQVTYFVLIVIGRLLRLARGWHLWLPLLLRTQVLGDQRLGWLSVVIIGLERIRQGNIVVRLFALFRHARLVHGALRILSRPLQLILTLLLLLLLLGSSRWHVSVSCCLFGLDKVLLKSDPIACRSQ